MNYFSQTVYFYKVFHHFPSVCTMFCFLRDAFWRKNFQVNRILGNLGESFPTKQAHKICMKLTFLQFPLCFLAFKRSQKVN